MIPSYQSTPKPFDEYCSFFPEALLYFGARCDRACSFCTVEGSPLGNYWKPTDAQLDALIRLTGPEGRIKVFGGEPALFVDDMIEVIRRLREKGFEGRITVFSNGIQAEGLIRILDFDQDVDCYLNYSIFHGRGAKVIPETSRRLLEEYHQRSPGKIYVGHAFLLPVGRKLRKLQKHEIEGCASCFPTVRGDGMIHACAFAAHFGAEQYHWGDVHAPFVQVKQKRTDFLEWIQEHVAPEAYAQGKHFCEVCVDKARASLASPKREISSKLDVSTPETTSKSNAPIMPS